MRKRAIAPCPWGSGFNTRVIEPNGIVRKRRMLSFFQKKGESRRSQCRWQGKEASSGRKQPTSMLDSINIINFTTEITMFFWGIILEPTQMVD
jgi:hypothetical protein